jgi:hypothetical protein
MATEPANPDPVRDALTEPASKSLSTSREPSIRLLEAIPLESRDLRVGDIPAAREKFPTARFDPRRAAFCWWVATRLETIEATTRATLPSHGAAAAALAAYSRIKESAQMRARLLELGRQTKNQQALVGGLIAEASSERLSGNAERARTLFGALRKTIPTEALYDTPAIVRIAAAVGDLVLQEAEASRLALWPQSPIWRELVRPAG